MSGATPASQIASRALALVEPESITSREDRLLSFAEEVGALAGTHPAFDGQMRLYLALVCCIWAERGVLDDRGRDAAIAAAAALSVASSSNLRELVGLTDKLRALARTCASRPLAEAARRAAEGRLESELDVYRSLDAAVSALEESSGEWAAVSG